MKPILVVLATILITTSVSFSQSASATYSAGDIPTDLTTYSGTCNGPVTPLVVTIPAGATVTGIDIAYTFTAINNAYLSEQRSRIHCQETGNTEATVNGPGTAAPGVQNYTRTGVTIANGVSATGTLTFEMQAWRTWGSSPAGCNTNYQYINNNSWTITVYYTIPTPMIYTSSTTTQSNTGNVENCATSAEIIGVEVVTSGSLTPLSATQFTIGTTGTTNLAELGAVNIYYTGTSSTFATGTLFGTVAPGGSVVVNGSQVLANGTNYFWIEYTLVPTMNIGNNLDATCTGLVVGGTGYTPSVTTPAGARAIGACNPAPGGIATNLQTWFDANVGTSGNPVTTWANAGPNVNVPSVTCALGSPLLSNYERANYNNIIDLQGNVHAHNGTFHHEVPQRTDVISGNGATMYCAYQSTGGPDLIFNFHSSVQGGGGGSTNQWYAWGFRHGGIGVLFSSGSGTAYDATQMLEMSSNSNFVGLNGTESSAGNSITNGTEVATANTGTWYSGTGDHEVSIGYWPGWGTGRDVMEAIIWDRDLTALERDRVETYLAIKYGITLGLNGTSMDYHSPSTGLVVWDVSANAGFNYDIAGISRSDLAGLDQRKSHSTNGPAIDSYNDIVTIANGTNFASPPAFTQDRAFLVWGHDNGPTINTGVVVNYPTDNGETIETIFQREWKAQESGTVNTVTLEFDLSGVVGPGGVLGSNDLQYLRLLVDEDGDYSDGGATSIAPSSYSNVTNIAYFEVDFVPPSGPETTPFRGYFFTLASTNVTMNPLPVELLSFDVTQEDCSNKIEWSTVSEFNSSEYVIQRSHDMNNWTVVGTVPAAGTSNSQLDYLYRDNAFEQNGLTYYRIIQVDLDGKETEIGLQVVNAYCKENVQPIAYPNPVTEEVNIKSAIAGIAKITDLNGRVVAEIEISEGVTSIEMSHLLQGTYLLQLSLINGKSYVDQFVKL